MLRYFGELAARHLKLPILARLQQIDIPYVYTKFGRFNPDSGSYPITQYFKYHFYHPHLRDTPVKPVATHILVLGDSFTFGLFLPWNQTYLYRLQHDANHYFGHDHYQFLNAATPGWGTAQYLSYLEHYGNKVSPKIVLVFLNTDDIGRSMKDLTLSYCKSHAIQYAKPSVKSHTLLLPKSIKNWIFNSWLFKQSALIHFMYYLSISVIFSSQDESNLLIPMSSDLSFDDQSAIHCGKSLFSQINQWCKTHHAKLIVITTGFNGFYPLGIHDPTKIFLTKAKYFFAQANIPYLDISSPFKKEVFEKPFQIPRDGHPNVFGAQVIEKLSWPWIKKQIKRREN